MKLCICGSAYHSSVIRKFLTPYFEFSTFEKADLVYYIGGPGPSFKLLRFWITDRRPLIVHWIGTDVIRFVNPNKRKDILKNILKQMLLKNKAKKGKVKFLTCAPWLIEELKNRNIESEYMPITALERVKYFNSTNKKRKIDFMSYIPTKKFNFYGGNKILEFAKKNNEFNFVLLLPDKSTVSDISFNSIPRNVSLIPKLTYEEVQRLLNQTKCFLRLTVHDGLSMSVLEALQNSCQVIWTYRFPYVNFIKENEFEFKAKNIIKNWNPNIEGSKYVIENFIAQKVYLNLKNKIFEFASSCEDIY